MSRICLQVFAISALFSIAGKYQPAEVLASQQSNLVDAWYEYTGPQTAIGRASESNYIKFSPQPIDIKVMCPGADVLCSIRVPDKGSNPGTFSPALEAQVESAVSLNIETDRIELGEH